MSNPYNDVPLVQWDRDDRLIVYMPNVSGVPTIPWITSSVLWAYYVPDFWTTGAAVNYGRSPVSMGVNAWVAAKISSSDNFSRTPDSGLNSVDVAAPLDGFETTGVLALAYDGNGRLWAVSVDAGFTTYSIQHSDDDGDSWTIVHTVNIVAGNWTGDFGAIWVSLDGQNIGVFGGKDTGPPFEDAWAITSSDGGGTWTEAAIDSGVSNPEQTIGIMWSGSYWLTITYDVSDNERMRISADGSSWSTAQLFDNTPATIFWDAGHAPTLLDSGIPVAIGYDPSNNTCIWRSPDGGATWESLALSPAISGATELFAFGADIYIFDVDGTHFWKLPSAGTTLAGTLTALADLPA